ncbi:MAG TPA: DUF5667 domain-containing protein [Candidatus Paceibacterota bacterium]|nr:DUF5667 domain-containing protein [Candidatus Paceibacterota bacterium]
MKKVLILSLAVVLVFFATVSAHEESSILEGRPPLVLPTNPLYIFKEIGRGLRRFFTFNQEAKALLDLEILSRRAEEIAALKEKGKMEGVLKTLGKYGRDARKLASRIDGLDAKRVVEGELVAEFTAKVLAHNEMFEDILGYSDEYDEEIEEVRKSLDEAELALIRVIGDVGEFAKIFEAAVADYEDHSLKEFNAVYVLDRIQSRLPPEAQNRIGALKDNLILRFEGRFRAESNDEFLAALDGLLLKSPEEIKILDEVREKVGDPDLRSKLNIVRQRAFLNAEENSIADREAVSDTISNAETALARFKNALASAGGKTIRSIEELAENADFHLEQAKKFFDNGEYGAAFGQATASLAEAESGLGQLSRNEDGFYSENLDLRLQFDELKNKARAMNLTPESNIEIFALFDRAESKVLEAKALEELRDAKVILVEIEARLRALEDN